jgi:ubiquinone/menaquinone biosynthesis C-methylase UbiE
LIVEDDVKRRVQEFYNSVGWKQIGEGVYQNARYEDLRPVSMDYIHRCHLRVARFLPAGGTYLLDAGSGPIQYPEYLQYSKGYRYRVCLDISILALKEARSRLGDRGLYVVADIAHLPFTRDTFDGIVSLHTIHHLPPNEHKAAFFGLHQLLKPGGSCVVVYTWGEHSPLMRFMELPMDWMGRFKPWVKQRLGSGRDAIQSEENLKSEALELVRTPGTFTYKHDYKWIKKNLKKLPGLDIRVWRTVSTKFLRTFVHRKVFGSFWLRILYRLEEIAPKFFGRIGQYPMILFYKPEKSTSTVERERYELGR